MPTLQTQQHPEPLQHVLPLHNCAWVETYCRSPPSSRLLEAAAGQLSTVLGMALIDNASTLCACSRRSHLICAGPLHARCVHHQLDEDNQGGWRNTIEARVGGLPTDQEIADQYLTPTAAAETYATQTTVNTLSGNADQQQRAIIALNAVVTTFPICDPLPVPTRGNTTDHEEHVPGTVVGISCNRGNTLTGATEAICLSNETWAYRGAVPTCAACTTQWLDVPWALSQWENIRGPGSRGRDYRTGNPRTTSSFNLPAIDIGNNGVSGFRFYFQCTCAPNNNPSTRLSPPSTRTRIAFARWRVFLESRPPSHACASPNSLVSCRPRCRFCP